MQLYEDEQQIAQFNHLVITSYRIRYSVTGGVEAGKFKSMMLENYTSSELSWHYYNIFLVLAFAGLLITGFSFFNIEEVPVDRTILFFTGAAIIIIFLLLYFFIRSVVLVISSASASIILPAGEFNRKEAEKIIDIIEEARIRFNNRKANPL